MNRVRNSIIVIHDYEYDNIEKIHREANTFWTHYYTENTEISTYVVSPIMKSVFNKEFTFMITGDCAFDCNLKNGFNSDRIKWCNYIYKVFLPQNIVVINLGDDGKSYIEHQLPNVEEDKSDYNTEK